jgi:hypothetical protein
MRALNHPTVFPKSVIDYQIKNVLYGKCAGLALRVWQETHPNIPDIAILAEVARYPERNQWTISHPKL